VAQALERMPQVRDSFVNGEVSSSAVGLLAEAVGSTLASSPSERKLWLTRQGQSRWRSCVEPSASGCRPLTSEAGIGLRSFEVAEVSAFAHPYTNGPRPG